MIQGTQIQIKQYFQQFVCTAGSKVIGRHSLCDVYFFHTIQVKTPHVYESVMCPGYQLYILINSLPDRPLKYISGLASISNAVIMHSCEENQETSRLLQFPGGRMPIASMQRQESGCTPHWRHLISALYAQWENRAGSTPPEGMESSSPGGWQETDPGSTDWGLTAVCKNWCHQGLKPQDTTQEGIHS